MSQIWPLIAIAGSWALYGFFASLLISKKVKYIRYTFFSAIIGSANNVIEVPSNIWYLSEFIKFLFVLLCLNLFVTFVQKD